MLFFLILTTLLYSAGGWKTLTNTSEVRDFIIADSTLWAATNGGLLKLDTGDLDYMVFTNTEGLAQIDVSAVAYDKRGYIWVALPNGLLQIYHIADQKWSSYNEFENRLTVKSIFCYDDFVLIASETGIAELRLDDRGRWERTWKAEIGLVQAITIAYEAIWVAQTDGVRRIALDFPNKQIPSAWTHWSAPDGLPSNQVHAIYPYNDTIVAGTESGLAFFDGTAWGNVQLADKIIRRFCLWQGSLCLASSSGIYALIGESWQVIGNAGTRVTAVGANESNQLWAATDNDGFLYYDGSNGGWKPFTANGPGANTFSDLLVDRDGHLWATSSKNPTGGVYFFNGSKWLNFRRADGLAHYDYRTIEEDSYGRIWAGSWGGGVTIFEKTDDDSIRFTNLYAMDGNLYGVDVNPNYVVITKIVQDEQGNLWFLNHSAANKQVVTVFDLDNSWEHWTTTEGIRSDKVISVAIDHFGRKWIGTDGNGLSVLDDNQTSYDKTDDDLEGFLDTSDGLESNTVTALVQDLDGTIWIGTTGGLNYWFASQVGARYNVINDNILSLFVDPRNNKWIGTVGGLSILDADNFSWTHYTTSNSALVSDVVTCFALNEKTGEMYIGTTNGLSRFETPFTKPADNLNSVIGYPNPYIIDQEGSRFYIDRLALNSSVRIFTADGFLVKTIPQSQVLGARVSWDGTNDQGAQVADGIYVYLVTTKEGESKAGKIALLRH